jgi:hypothetical protein
MFLQTAYANHVICNESSVTMGGVRRTPWVFLPQKREQPSGRHRSAESPDQGIHRADQLRAACRRFRAIRRGQAGRCSGAVPNFRPVPARTFGYRSYLSSRNDGAYRKNVKKVAICVLFSSYPVRLRCHKAKQPSESAQATFIAYPSGQN